MELNRISSTTDIGYMYSAKVGAFLTQELEDRTRACSARKLWFKFKELCPEIAIRPEEFVQAAHAAGFVIERRTWRGRPEKWIRWRLRRRYDGRTYGDPKKPVRSDMGVRVRAKYQARIPADRQYHIGEFALRHRSEQWTPVSELRTAFVREVGWPVSAAFFGRLLRTLGYEVKRMRRGGQNLYHARCAPDVSLQDGEFVLDQ